MKTLAKKPTSITLPEEYESLLNFIGRREQRTRSDVIREALSLYFQARDLLETPTAEEIREIKKGQRSQESFSLKTVKNELGFAD